MRTRDCACVDEDLRFVGDNAELPVYEKKQLPTGTWIRLLAVDPETTEEEIQKVILDRTGIELPLENIAMRSYRPTISGALISLDKVQINALFAWALSTDELRGRPIVIGPPLLKAQW